MRSISLVFLAYMLLFISTSAGANNSFSIKVWKQDNAGIWLVIDTTLPDHVDVRVSVGRAIISIEDKKIIDDDGITVEREPEKTWFGYFNSREQVSQWRKPRPIRMDDVKWSQELKEHADKQSAIGVPFEVKKVTDEVKISAYAYGNRIGEPYENREYKDLTERVFGTRVAKRSEITINRSWAGFGASPIEPSIVNAYFLEVNKSYRLIKDNTPMTEVRHTRSLEELGDMLENVRYLPAGTVIHVIEVVGHEETKPYYPPPHYRVSLPERLGAQGWIYSTALSPDGVTIVVDEPMASRFGADKKLALVFGWLRAE